MFHGSATGTHCRTCRSSWNAVSTCMLEEGPQLPPCFCTRKDLHVLCLSRQLIMHTMSPGFGDTGGSGFQPLLAGAATCHGQHVTAPVMFLFLSFTRPFDETTNSASVSSCLTAGADGKKSQSQNKTAPGVFASLPHFAALVEE